MFQRDKHVIAVYSPKGGVGKTTISVDLAWRFATQGRHKSIIWDLDPQRGSGFLLDIPQTTFNASSLFHREGRLDKLVVPSGYENLDAICADDSLRDLPAQLARLGTANRIANVIYKLKTQYDRIVLDCPPMQNELSNQILGAADIIILPLPPSPLSARALEMLRKDLKALHGRHAPILPVISMFDNRRKEHLVARETHMAEYPVIPYSGYIEKTAFRRAPLGSFAQNCEASRALQRVYNGIEAKLAEIQGGYKAPVMPAPRILHGFMYRDQAA